MAERKQVNKYYPPDYDPRKGGLNKFQGTHALRERAKKLHLGILVIRFEMPYNIWCSGCKNHIGTGVRYNAEKKKVGMYYSTAVYQFRMKCHLCDNYFEIKTDPGNLDYEIVSGAARQERRWDPDENEQVAPEDREITRKMAKDAMFKVEHGVADKEKAQEVKDTLEHLKDFQSSRWEDDYAANCALREKMRDKRNKHFSQKAIDDKLNINVPLLPPSEEDARTAKYFTYGQTDSTEEPGISSDPHTIFAKLRTKRVSASHKKEFATQAIRKIAEAKRKRFDTFSNEPLKRDLGIKKRVSVPEELPSNSSDGATTSQSHSSLAALVAYDSSESD